MTKIAYNTCYGGFSLSGDAVRLARELSGNPKWGNCVLYGEMYADGSGPSTIKNSQHPDDISRSDPILITVIETLGKKANGYCASLDIRDLPSGTLYRIDEYDGAESVITNDEHDWSVA